MKVALALKAKCAEQLSRLKEMLDTAIEYGESCGALEDEEFLDIDAAIVQLGNVRATQTILNKKLMKLESKVRAQLRKLAKKYR